MLQQIILSGLTVANGLGTGGFDLLPDTINAIKSGSAIEQAKTLAKDYAEKAMNAIKKLPPSRHRNGLKTIVQLIIDRDF